MIDLRKAIHEVIVDSQMQQKKASSERDLTLSLLVASVRKTEKFLGNLEERVLEPKDRVAFSLFLTIYQLAQAMLTLATSGPNIAIPTLARQAVDAFVDLVNLFKYDSYWKSLERADDESWLKMLEYASRGDNDFLKSIYSSEDLPARRREHRDRIKDWDRHQVLTYKIRKRFELAEMVDVYEAVYGALSGSCHNNLSALIGRHIDIDDGNALHSPCHVPYELPAITQVAEYLNHATVKIHENYGSGELDDSGMEMVRRTLEDALSCK